MFPIGFIVYSGSLILTKSFPADESQFLKLVMKKTSSLLRHKISFNRNTTWWI